MSEAIAILELEADGASELGAVERSSVIAGVDGAMARLTAVRARLLVAERDSGAWRAGGAASFAQWRGSTSGGGQGAAIREERQADALVGLAAVAQAARSGVIGLGHVDAIARVAADRSESVRAAVASPEGQAELVELAKTQDAPGFGRAVQRWAAGHESDALESSHQAQRRARFLNLSATDAGTRVRGLLDAQSGHRLRLALEAVSPRPAADDDRSSEQRAADALLTLAEAALADPTTAPGAAVRPHVSYLMREQAFVALRRRRATTTGDGLGTATGPAPVAAGDTAGRAGRAGDSAGDPPVVAAHDAGHDVGRKAGDPPSGTGHDGGDVAATVGPGGDAQSTGLGSDALVLLEDGTPVPRSEAERALCDCEITRIVVDADDVPMNLGRTQRLYVGVHRRAVIARDRSCRWAGCSVPARWCEIHHIRWWDRDNGDTSVTNAVLLCAFHHHETHRRDLDVARLAPPPSGSRKRRERRNGSRRADPRTDDPGPDPAGEHRNCADHHDGSGGARYRFVDTTGRVGAGPEWTESQSGHVHSRARNRSRPSSDARAAQTVRPPAGTPGGSHEPVGSEGSSNQGGPSERGRPDGPGGRGAPSSRASSGPASSTSSASASAPSSARADKPSSGPTGTSSIRTSAVRATTGGQQVLDLEER